MHRTLALTAALALLLAGVARAQQPPNPAPPTEAEKQALAKVRQLGGLAMELAQNDNHLEVIYLQSDGKFSDEYLVPLEGLKGRLVHLNLGGQPVTDAQLAHLKGLTDLTELHLEKTKITDKGLENLRGLTNLEYLNLYGTDVTDQGLVNLEGLKKLKHLYLWQTKVTDAGAAKLKKAIAGVDVNRGAELEVVKEEKKPEPAKAPEKKPEEKKPEEKKPEEKKPEPKKDDKKPEAKEPEKKPEPKKDDKKPEPKKDDKKPDDQNKK
jgi:hypothetical protein